MRAALYLSGLLFLLSFSFKSFASSTASSTYSCNGSYDYNRDICHFRHGGYRHFNYWDGIRIVHVNGGYRYFRFSRGGYVGRCFNRRHIRYWSHSHINHYFGFSLNIHLRGGGYSHYRRYVPRYYHRHHYHRRGFSISRRRGHCHRRFRC